MKLELDKADENIEVSLWFKNVWFRNSQTCCWGQVSSTWAFGYIQSLIHPILLHNSDWVFKHENRLQTTYKS